MPYFSWDFSYKITNYQIGKPRKFWHKITIHIYLHFKFFVIKKVLENTDIMKFERLSMYNDNNSL